MLALDLGNLGVSWAPPVLEGVGCSICVLPWMCLSLMALGLGTILSQLTLLVLGLLGGQWLIMYVGGPFLFTSLLLGTLCAPCLTTQCWFPICPANVATL